jgi:hypothetical protein
MTSGGWESIFEGRRVVVVEPVVRDLRRLAIEGFLALPRRGIEVGGILFGESNSKGMRIQGFEEVPCEHRYGPSYALSDSDRAQMAELLESRRAIEPPVAGFFRSYASREPAIEEADETFVREHFPKGYLAFLMLQPTSAETCVASLRLFRDGQLLPDMEDAATDFGTPWAPPEEPAESEVLVSAASPVMEAPEPMSEATRPMSEAIRPMSEAIPPMSEARTMSEAIPPTGETKNQYELPPSFRSREKEPAPAWEGTQQAARQVEPAWRAAVPVRRSRAWIPAVILLAVACAAGGYALGLRGRTAQWTDLRLNARNNGGHLQLSWDASAPAAAEASRGLLAVGDGATHRDIELSASEVRKGSFTLPTAGGDVALRLVLYSKGSEVAGDSLRVATISSAPPNPPAEIPKPPSNDADREAQAPAEAARRALVAVPPLIVHEVQPFIPEGIRSRIRNRTVIPVNVEVSERGRVLRAVAEPQSGGGVSRYLAEQAQKAARDWRFSPARTKSGARVAASKTIDFVFTP